MAQFEVTNLTDAFGVRVKGLDLTQDFDDETRAKLRKILDERGALVFSGLDIPTINQDRLCRMLCGDDERDAGKRDPQYVTNSDKGGYAPYGRLLFHGDMMWHPKPFQVLSLYGQKVEANAATTSLASGVVAWKKLPADLREQVEKLEVIHTTGTVFSRGGPDLLRSDRENEISTTKPIKFIHPRTGEPILYVSQQTTRQVVGMEPEESEAFLQKLFSYLYAPDNVYEHTWSDGDMLVFDNIAVQHARGNVLLDGPKRTLRKVIAPVPKINMEAPTFEKTRASA
jgi:alpha-ketoglutarate-dependent taurine dioxygenase